MQLFVFYSPSNYLTEKYLMSECWLLAEEMAEYLSVGKDAVYVWINKKNMPTHRTGRFWKFKIDKIDQWVRFGGAAESDGERDPKQ